MRVAALVALSLVAATARAGVGVIAVGEPVAQGPVQALAEAWLQEHEQTVVASPLGEMKATFANCFVIEDLACARGVFEKRSTATSVVFVRVELEAGRTGRDYSIIAYWFVKGHDPALNRRRCPACDDAMLSKTVDALLTDLIGDSALHKGRLKITSGPNGAIVWIDDVKRGVAPLERDLAPGSHEIKFTDHGRTLGTKHVSIEEGSTIAIASPTIGDAPAASPWPARLLIGGGISAVVAGGVFLYYGQLGGPDEPYIYTRATAIGIPVTIVGIAGVIAGSVLWFRGRETNTPTVAISSGGAQVGWAGSF